ncbi:MAG: type II secretion system protein [Desulfosarcina sp.]|nr:type II secretion system protein [Desulfobacterales bacterium]
MKKESGFTLLEIILALVIFSIIVAVAGLGIVTGVKGYVFARQNAHSAQKAQMALARITREFQELYNITAAASNSVTFEGRDGECTIELDAPNNTLLLGGDILIDEIKSDGFTLTFYKDGVSGWTQEDSMESLTDIEIRIDMIRNDVSDGSLTFETFVHPRNIGYW